MNIGVILAVAGIIAALAVKSVIDGINDKKRLLDRLKAEWGEYPETEYAPGRLESISYYYFTNKEDTDIDDITWNDLNMDDLYKLLNHTECAMGEEALYNILRKPEYDPDTIMYRNKIISHFYNEPEKRVELQSVFAGIGKNRKISFFEYYNILDSVKKERNYYHYLILIIWLADIICLLVQPASAVFITLANVILSISTYYRRKLQIESYYSCINNLLRLLYSTKKLIRIENDVIKAELDDLRVSCDRLKGLSRNSGIVLSPNGGSLLDIIVDYLRMFTHVDLIKFNKMIKIAEDNREHIINIFNIIGTLDACIAIASFRQMQNNSGWCVPQLTDDTDMLTTKDIYHPFLSDPVYNSFCSGRCSLITGSNASGKSTFLKAVAINAVMAQTIATVTAKTYKAKAYRIMTSMALNDTILNNKSYFIVELNSLKRIIDSDDDRPVLCCIDEVLRGTNTIERIAASGQILKYLAVNNIMCFAATHDLELAKILDGYYDNYHFREQIIDDNIVFDYILHRGSAVTHNAINLLNMLGFDEKIVNGARNNADYFEKNGIWEQV